MIQFVANSRAEAEQALAAGCTWIHCTDPDALDDIIAPCREADAILTLGGSPSKVMDTRVHGVILGSGDTPAAEVREFLGPHAIIGCTVSTLFEMLSLAQLDVDFFVLNAPVEHFGEIVRLARAKGVKQRISALDGTKAHLSAGADAILTSDPTLLNIL